MEVRKKIEGGYDLSTDSKRNIAENRVRGYATSAARPVLRHPSTRKRFSMVSV